MFKDTPDGQTHYENDGCGDRSHNSCDHVCTGNCRMVGCNCECGEWHEEKLDEVRKQKL